MAADRAVARFCRTCNSSRPAPRSPSRLTVAGSAGLQTRSGGGGGFMSGSGEPHSHPRYTASHDRLLRGWAHRAGSRSPSLFGPPLLPHATRDLAPYPALRKPDRATQRFVCGATIVAKECSNAGAPRNAAEGRRIRPRAGRGGGLRREGRGGRRGRGSDARARSHPACDPGLSRSGHPAARRQRAGHGGAARTTKLLREFGEDYHERELEEANLFPKVRSAGGRPRPVSTCCWSSTSAAAPSPTGCSRQAARPIPRSWRGCSTPSS